MAAPGSRHRAERGWWQAPVLRGLTRRQAQLVLAGVTVLALALGSGSGAAVRSAGTAPVDLEMTELGPMQIHLPDDVGPWSAVPASSFDQVRVSSALGHAVINGAWGVVAPGAVVVTVLTAQSGTHGGVDSVRAGIPQVAGVSWQGRRSHTAGAQVRDGVRELILAVEARDGDLVILSVSGPVAAFESGTLDQAFSSARLDD